jgi:hypothetical protein
MLYDLLFAESRTSSKGRRGRRGTPQSRKCRVEHLENRCLLSAANLAVTLLPAPPIPIYYGQSETITAVVSDPAMANVPGGTITVADNGTALTGVTTTSDSTADTLTGTVTILLPAAGTNNIVVNYSGDTNFDPNSATTSFLVQPAATTTTITTPSPSSSVFGQSVTIAATVGLAPSGPAIQAAAVANDTPSSVTVTGWVDFFDNATATSSGVYLGSGRVAADGTVQLTTSRLPVGTDSITATFRGNADFATSTSAIPLVQTVTPANTTTTLTINPNPSTFGQTVVMMANVTATTSGHGRVNGTVSFEEVAADSTTTTLGTAPVGFGGWSVFTTNTLAIGSYTIEAVFNPGNGNSVTSTSSTVTEVVNLGAPTVKLSTPPGSYPLTVGGSLTVTATVGVRSGFGGFSFGGWNLGGGSSTLTPPTGTVNFLLNGTVVGTGMLTSGQDTFTFTDLPQGTDTLTVQYLGDTNYAAATGTLTVTVPTPTRSTGGGNGGFGGYGGGIGGILQWIFANWDNMF